MKLRINIDGASRGNPGPGAASVVIKNQAGAIMLEDAKYLGECTNNQAEFTALDLALEHAANLKGTELDIFSDSLLLVNQFNGIYKIKNPALAEMMSKIRRKADNFKRIKLSHVPREQNAEADRLGNIALDARAGKTSAKPKSGSGSGEQLKLF